MEEYKEAEHLLSQQTSPRDSEAFLPNDIDRRHASYTKPSRFERLKSISLAVSLCLHVLSTALLFMLWSKLPTKPADNTVSIKSLTGLKYDTPVEYLQDTNYWSVNETLADSLWEALPTDTMVVAIPDAWAAQHNLMPSGRWPWDDTRGRYYVQGLHELHCLKYVRHYVKELERGRGHLMEPAHAGHCMDMLRQTIMCRADDNLQHTSDHINFTIGDRQIKKCRSFDKLLEWSRAPERHACHRVIDDYRTIKHGIERYAFCPDHSPYKAVQEQWFAEHGHVDPWN